MPDSQYHVGQLVHLNTGRVSGSRETYEVTRLLPFDGDDPRYRIKSMREPYERVAMGSQLERRSSAQHD